MIIALDHPDARSALAQVDLLRDLCPFFKIGLELFVSGGPRIVEAVRERGGRVFLDLKMHDIPETVARAVKVAAALEVEFLTLHAGGGFAMMHRAAEAVSALPKANRPRLLAVTVLTSLTEEDLQQVGDFSPNLKTATAGAPNLKTASAGTPSAGPSKGETASAGAPSLKDLVLRRALLAQSAGVDGVVASPQEVLHLRHTCGAGLFIVTPGVRLLSAEGPPGQMITQQDDQMRTGTPVQAVADGADRLVIGRPIRDAKDPRALVASLLRQIEQGTALRRQAAGRGAG